MTLPIIHDAMDAWYCERIVNEALLEMNHHGRGPVHINVPTIGINGGFGISELPKVKRVKRISAEAGRDAWIAIANKIAAYKRILIVLGENDKFDEKTIADIEHIALHTDSVVSVEHMSSYKGAKSVFTYRATEAMSENAFKVLLPNLVISAAGNIASVNLKKYLRAARGKIEHWSIRQDGLICDEFKNISYIFDCSPEFFFRNLSACIPEINDDDFYYQEWSTVLDSLQYPKFSFSNFSIARKIATSIPAEANLDLGILNSTRTMQFFDLPKSVNVSSNIGALGIDGTLSTAIGRAAVSDRLCYVVLGDLSFFYDMNALNIQAAKSKLRVILVNNQGACEFHIGNPRSYMPNIDEIVAAGHSATAEAWAIAQGFKYYSAHSQQEFDKAFDETIDFDGAVLIEAFTNRDYDAKQLDDFYDLNSNRSPREKFSAFARTAAKTQLGQKLVKKLQK